MSKKRKLVCTECGSDQIKIDAFAEWDEEAGKWVLASVFDQTICETCGGETNTEWVDVEEADALLVDRVYIPRRVYVTYELSEPMTVEQLKEMFAGGDFDYDVACSSSASEYDVETEEIEEAGTQVRLDGEILSINDL